MLFHFFIIIYTVYKNNKNQHWFWFSLCYFIVNIFITIFLYFKYNLFKIEYWNIGDIQFLNKKLVDCLEIPTMPSQYENIKQSVKEYGSFFSEGLPYQIAYVFSGFGLSFLVLLVVWITTIWNIFENSFWWKEWPQLAIFLNKSFNNQFKIIGKILLGFGFFFTFLTTYSPTHLNIVEVSDWLNPVAQGAYLDLRKNSFTKIEFYICLWILNFIANSILFFTLINVPLLLLLNCLKVYKPPTPEEFQF
jgi:hypothetical protein